MNNGFAQNRRPPSPHIPDPARPGPAHVAVQRTHREGDELVEELGRRREEVEEEDLGPERSVGRLANARLLHLLPAGDAHHRADVSARKLARLHDLQPNLPHRRRRRVRIDATPPPRPSRRRGVPSERRRVSR